MFLPKKNLTICHNSPGSGSESAFNIFRIQVIGKQVDVDS
jgi:hypothetical protein